MDKMNIAVLGLGTEGKHAVKSLLDYGNHVYASDLNKDINCPNSTLKIWKSTLVYITKQR